MKLAEILKELEIAHEFMNRAEGHHNRNNLAAASHYYREVILKFTTITTTCVEKLQEIKRITNE